MKKKIASGLALVLSLSMLICGCGSKDAGQTTNDSATSENNGGSTTSEYGYEVTNISLPKNYGNMYNSYLVGDQLWSMVTEYAGEEASEAVSVGELRMSEDGQDTSEGLSVISEGAISADGVTETNVEASWQYESVIIKQYSVTEQKEISSLVLNTDELKDAFGDKYQSNNINKFVIMPDNSISVMGLMYSVSGEDNYSSTYFISKVDADGNLYDFFTLDEITQNDENNYVEYYSPLKNGGYAVSMNQGVVLVDESGKKTGEINAGGWVNGLYLIGEEVYCQFYDASYKCKFARVDAGSKSFVDAVENYPQNGSSVIPCLTEDGHLITVDDTSIVDLNIKDSSSEALLKLMDVDIVASNIRGVSKLSDGRLVVSITDWTGNGQDNSIAILERKLRSEMKTKLEIRVASLYENDISEAIVEFNKSQDQIHVSYDYYYDWSSDSTIEDAQNSLMNALTGNNPPDMLILEQISNVNAMINKNMFVDLRSIFDEGYLERYQSELVSIYSSDTGEVYAVPKNYGIIAIIGSSKDLGEKQGWTIDEFLDYAEAKSNASVFRYVSRNVIINFCLSACLDSFIDEEKGECHFDNETFARVLKLAAKYPEEINYDDETSEATAVSGGNVLLAEAYLGELSDLQMYTAMFPDGYVVKGYPTSDGSVAHGLNLSGGLAIMSSSSNLDACKAFEKFYMEHETTWSYGFSTRKGVFDEKVEEQLKGKGEKTGSSLSYGDGWTYEYHYATETEINEIRNLITNCRNLGSISDTVMGIIKEEADAFYAGQKTAEEVTSIIQSRVSLYLIENM